MCTPLEPKHREYRQETAAKGAKGLKPVWTVDAVWGLTPIQDIT